MNYRMSILFFKYLDDLGEVVEMLKAREWRFLGVMPWPIGGCLVGLETEFEAEGDRAAIKAAQEIIRGTDAHIYGALLYREGVILATRSTLVA